MFRKLVLALPLLCLSSLATAQSLESLASALDANEFMFESDAPSWAAQNDTVFPGLSGNQSAAKAATISDGQQTAMSTLATSMDTGVLKFHWRVSSEINDRLTFSATDLSSGLVVASLSIAGVTDWSEQEVGLSSGNYEFKWAYIKDAATSFADDTGWVDNLRFESIQPTTNSEPEDDEFCTVVKASNGNIALICL